MYEKICVVKASTGGIVLRKCAYCLKIMKEIPQDSYSTTYVQVLVGIFVTFFADVCTVEDWLAERQFGDPFVHQQYADCAKA